MKLSALSCAIIIAMESAIAAGVPVPPSLQMMIAATLAVYIGCHFGVVARKDEPREAAMTHSDAAQMPLVAGGALVFLYVCFKYVDPSIVNLILKGYFVAVGVAAVTTTTLAITRYFFNHDTSKPLFTVPRIPEIMDAIPVTPAGIVAFLIASAVCAWYALTNHWLANNALGFAFCVQGVAMLNIGSYGVGALLLSGLFIYDIVMVFFSGKATGGESIMVAVATKVDGPIKLLFPLPEGTSSSSGRSHSLLGLGDIIVPGVFLAHLLRFDQNQAVIEEEKRQRRVESESSDNETPRGGVVGGSGDASAARGNATTTTTTTTHEKNGGMGPRFDAVSSSFASPYFNAGLLSYVIGLAATTIVMYSFDSPQPALLYLVPAVLLMSSLQAVFRGEWSALWGYNAGDGGDDSSSTTTTGNADAFVKGAALPSTADAAAVAAAVISAAVEAKNKGKAKSGAAPAGGATEDEESTDTTPLAADTPNSALSQVMANGGKDTRTNNGTRNRRRAE